jgi:hypothetical protein
VCVRMWTGLNWLRIMSYDGILYEYATETLVYFKAGNSLTIQ